MKRLEWWLSAIGLLLYIVFVWFLAGWLRLHGGSLWVLRIALWLIGIAATAVIIYFVTKARQSAFEPAEGEADLRGDIEFLAREANAHLAASQKIRGGGKDLASLPLILFLGDGGAAKTSVILNSGLEPEQLAGEVYKDGAVISTRVANFWLGAGATLVEAGAGLAASPASMRRALDLLRARTLANLLGRSSQAPRAVVICYECSNFIAIDARNVVDRTARRLRSLLGDIAQRWGSRLPVYMLFTKLDQVTYFVDYFRNLTPDESSKLFGVTLAQSPAGPAGAYGELQTRRLNELFESLFGSLSDRRLDFLRREDDLAKTPNVYEFPREFRKLRDNLVRFLVDVGRPSLLRASPFLRGFYFTGVRPVMVSDGAAPPLEQAAPLPYGDDVGATRLFALPGRAAAAQPSPARALSSRARRVPQWVFVTPLFTSVLLADRAALGASGYDTRAGTIRRGLGAAALAALAVWIIGASVSYSNNGETIRRASAASQYLAAIRFSPGQTPSLETLRQLEDLRQVAAGAIDRQRYGAPMSLRWGVYPGEDLYQRPVALYCREFDRLLLSETRASFADYFRHLPTAPNPGDGYQRPFDSLRAYLMATSQASRAEPGFLAGMLSSQWAGNRAVSDETAALARAQFAFYASHRNMNLCQIKPDADAIGQARAYLLAFQPLERIYRAMLAEVSKRGQPFTFLDPAGAVVDGQQVAFPYTKLGWPVMQKQIREVTMNYGRDPWVLGEGDTAGSTSTFELQRQVSQRYAADYVAQWQQFLDRGTVSQYVNIQDAARKLDAMTSPQSSLLRLFCGIAVNTSVDASEVQSGFQPIQQLQPPATCENKLNDAATQPYMQAMVAFEVQVDGISKLPDPSGAALDSANARVAAKTTAQNLNLPPKGGQLLLDPIINAENALRGLPLAGVNGKGSQFCQQTANVLQRFPFNPHSNLDALVPEFIAVFQPGMGSLAMFFQNSLQDLLTAGVPATRKPGAKVNVRPEFLNFFNHAQAISRAFFPANTARPSLAYSVQALPSNDVENFTVQIGGRALRSFGERQDFVWNGDSVAVSLSARARDGTSPAAPIFSGPWSLFHLLSAADRVTSGAAIYEYDIRASSSFGRQSTTTRSSAVLRLQVDAKGFPGLFGAMGTGCVGRVAQ
jgi:type VI secretion system protein ImpL